MTITRMGDFIYALRIITLLTTPWEKQEAYKYGIIDKDGKRLRRFRDLKTSEEKDSFTYLHRIVFNLKRLLGTIPGGKAWLSAATASLLLLREGLKELDISERGWRLVEEAIFNMQQEDTPVNVTGSSVSTDTPKPIDGIVRRKKTDLDDDDDTNDNENDKVDLKQRKAP